MCCWYSGLVFFLICRRHIWDKFRQSDYETHIKAVFVKSFLLSCFYVEQFPLIRGNFSLVFILYSQDQTTYATGTFTSCYAQFYCASLCHVYIISSRKIRISFGAIRMRRHRNAPTGCVMYVCMHIHYKQMNRLSWNSVLWSFTKICQNILILGTI